MCDNWLVQAMRACRESQAEGASHSILRCPGSRKSMLVDPGSAGQLKTNENSCRVGMQSSLTHKLMYLEGWTHKISNVLRH